MTRLRTALFALLAFAVAGVSAQDAPPKAKMDLAKLVGSYRILNGVKGGEKMAADAKGAPITFTKDKISMKSQDMAFVFEYKVDETKKPAQIEMTILEPDALKGNKTTGIIKADGPSLTMVYDPQGQQTPKEFKSTADNGFFLFELERAKGDGKEKGKYKGKKKKDEPKDPAN